MNRLFAALMTAASVTAAASAAEAQSRAPDKPVHEVRLDLDGDGKRDLVRLVEQPPRSADLHVFYGVGDAPPPEDRKPDVVKTGIAENFFISLSAKGRGSLVVKDDCGGCTQSSATTLTIVHRNGRLLVAGLEIDWEMREESGRCDINFLTGKGTIAVPWNGRPRPIRKPLRPVPLDTWDFYDGRELCEPPSRR